MEARAQEILSPFLFQKLVQKCKELLLYNIHPKHKGDTSMTQSSFLAHCRAAARPLWIFRGKKPVLWKECLKWYEREGQNIPEVFDYSCGSGSFFRTLVETIASENGLIVGNFR